MRQWCFSLLMAFSLGATADATTMTHILREAPTLAGFDFCWGGTCAGVLRISLDDAEWARVRALFEPAPENAGAEREAISRAVGLLESIVGPKTGTAGDRAGTFGNSAYPGQLDCNDEATNTTSYLRMMVADGLVRFHGVQDTATRGRFLIFGRHSSAVMVEQASGRKFAVDSWFYDNGKPAVVLPLEDWRTGWKPADSKAH